MPIKCHIFGHSGRIGSLLLERLQQLELSHTSNPKEASIWLLAVPASAVEEILQRAQDRWVIDLSGYSKRKGIGHNGWDLSILPITTRLIQNPGCIAASVLLGLQQSGLAKCLAPADSIQVTAVCGRSIAHRSEQLTSPRLAKRLWSHPHVQEIQHVFPNVSIGHFTPIIHSDQSDGIFTSVTGTASQDLFSCGENVQFSRVVGTPNVEWQLRVHPDKRRFVLNVALDNLHYPVWHAAQWATTLNQGFTM